MVNVPSPDNPAVIPDQLTVSKHIEQPKKPISERARSLLNKFIPWINPQKPNPDAAFQEIAKFPLRGNEDITDADRRMFKEDELRAGVYKDIFLPKEDEQFKTKMIAFYNEVKNRIPINKKVEKPRIFGKSGEELIVIIGETNLQKFLPDSTFRFFGVPVIPETDSPIPDLSMSSSPRVHLPAKQVQLVTELQSGAKGKVTADIQGASLAILHEIGHCRDEYKNHRFIPVIITAIKARHFPSSLQDIDPFLIERLNFAVNKGNLNIELLRQEVFLRIDQRLEYEFSAQDSNLERTFRFWGESGEGAKSGIGEMLKGEVWDLYREAIQGASSGQLEKTIKVLTQKIEVRKRVLKEEAGRTEEEWVSTGERAAWAEALVMARELIKKDGVKLWQGRLDGLFFEIDRMINAHGRAGRLGVKRLSSRAKLLLPFTAVG